MSRLAVRLAPLLLVLAGGLLGTARAADTVTLVDGWGGNALRTTSADDYSPVVVGEAGGERARWIEESVSGEVYRYRNAATGDYLTVTEDRSGSSVTSAPLVPDWGSQQWRRRALGDGVFRLESVWTGRYLNATGESAGATVDASDLVESWGSLRWRIDAVDGGGSDDDGGSDGGGSDGGGEPAPGTARGIGPDIEPTGEVRTVRPGDDVAQAIADAPAGATLHFEPGTYYGVSVDLTKRLTLDGEPGVVFDGQGGTLSIGIYDGASDSRVQDIEIRNYRDGIHVAGPDRVALANLRIRDIGYGSGNQFVNVDTAIQIDNSTGSSVRRCDIAGADQKGIGVGLSRDVDVTDNIVRNINGNSRYNPDWNVGAIKYFTSSGRVSNNETGEVRGNAIWIDTSRYVQVHGNLARSNDDGGVYIEKTVDSRVFGNDAERIIVTEWSLDNGTRVYDNDVELTREPDYWNCGSFDCGADERDRAYGVTSGRAGQF